MRHRTFAATLAAGTTLVAPSALAQTALAQTTVDIGAKAPAPNESAPATQVASSPDENVPTTHARATTIALDEAFRSRSAFRGSYPSSIPLTDTFASSIIDVTHRFASTEIVATLPFAFETHPAQGGGVAAGNIAFGVYHTQRGDSLHLRLGGSLVLPTSANSGAGSYITSTAAASRALDRVWLWVPDYTSITLDALFGSNDENVFQHATGLVLVPMIHTGSDSTGLHYTMQLSEDVGAHVGLFRAGLHFETVFTSAPEEAFAVSLLPYAGIDGPAGFIDLGLRFFVNAPDSGHDDGVWGLRLRGGVRF